jgi:uncharacterized protein YkwD
VLVDGLQKMGWNRLGVGVLRSPSELVVAVALFRQQIELRPVPRQLPSRGSATVAGRLLRGHAEPQLIVTAPAGVVRMLPLRAQGAAFEATFLCFQGDGRYQVEVMGKDRTGPDVLANFPVYCGVAPPAHIAALDEREEDNPDPADVEQELLALINREREVAGLPPARWDNRLAAIARSHSREMAAGDFVAHVSPTTGDAEARVRRAGLAPGLLAENVGAAHGARQAHRGFMASPGHRANIVNRYVTHVGIGAAVARNANGPASLFVTQLFAAGL